MLCALFVAPVPVRAESAPPSAAPAYAPCPIVRVPRPSLPAPPTPDPARPAIGGPGLKTAGLTVPPAAPTPPAVTATSWLVADLDTGAVLGACGPHRYATPASVQKLLLAATMLPKLNPAQVIQVTAADMDFEPGSSAMGVVRGGRYRIETLWLGLMLNSGNDAANVLARLGAGSAARGVEAMNAEARRLGAFDTHAATPSGLDGPRQYTSAYDLALIARACFARGDFRRYVSTRQAQVPAQPELKVKGFGMQNDNQLLFQYPGALGGKTGYTDLARHTFVGAAERGGRRLLVTLLGAESQPVRGWQQGAALLDWGFALRRDAAVGRLITPDEAVPAEHVATPEPSARAPQARTVGNADEQKVVRTGIAISVVAVLLLGLLATTWWRAGHRD
ncbi:D-alanyl-D-alanine carboxypeptidase (penicillin-binding protein 5/6) [Micromonospora pattaloongensis]|uniref:D-alanyl-D-alanine carboxypeptidase (Penicillin-binding protein 5/6) n=1 Tax=Micromonospora pattaloongensis TaxID=405436 RepID=A0A1H3NKE5_9ACTN|nr:D-alanyl-D-alanine carboxypeptidase (penicillin-binding protein 5/6) [Micromonospora pattaloongensis]